MPLLLLLLAAVFVAHFFWLLAALGATAVAGRLIGGWLARRDDATQLEQRRQAEICARADRQHAQVLAGDERGVYGRYPPTELLPGVP